MSPDPLAVNLIHRVNVGDSLTRSAERHPDALALSDGSRRLTYSRFDEQVNRVAHSLIDYRVAVGDAVALASGNSIEFLTTYYACAKIGAVCVPINLDWRADEVAYVLGDCAARIFVVESELAETMSEAAATAGTVEVVAVVGPRPRHDFGAASITDFDSILAHSNASQPERLVGDRAALTYLYTSGTTSAPKGVVGNHTAVYLESMTMIIEGQFRPEDRFAAILPMFHTAQLNCHCTPAIMVGAALHIQRGFDPQNLLSLIESEHITQLFGLPMMYRAMLEHHSIDTRNLSSVRRALYAMAPMPQNMLERCIDVFDCEFYLLFGQTEMSPTATIFRPENQLTHSGSVGTPVVNVQVAIMDEDGNRLQQGRSGEIVYRGPHVMTEYLGRPDATDEAFRDGWFHSGDIGHFDDDGILWFTDRNKDVIKSGGENISSVEVEKALYSAEPGAAEVVVVGLPHDRWSEAVTAFVVPRPDTILDQESIRTKMRDHIDAYKIPKAVIIVDLLPKTATGKVRKNIVRDSNRSFYQQL
ncbi:long-chain-fatty-acid--CoA ligase [Rhodococcoides kyotonense]|uniref:Acyl-CoA synthetase (AMP-forming)/AMP-acid ligase II n=1 Tax=Rhodococcoides kyotonense TaxID=398843 RepID=A0A239MZ52_9NOCA|nr:long-chain-fatty-acid--CoA ligase [Rhodococcus kyotonensis]SNT47472.1 Acyl-CoA synthetase (AMP-forming)/AMP-acid ligase II [Rhodococcus kyotonensis]